MSRGMTTAWLPCPAYLRKGVRCELRLLWMILSLSKLECLWMTECNSERTKLWIEIVFVVDVLWLFRKDKIFNISVIVLVRNRRSSAHGINSYGTTSDSLRRSIYHNEVLFTHYMVIILSIFSRGACPPTVFYYSSFIRVTFIIGVNNFKVIGWHVPESLGAGLGCRSDVGGGRRGRGRRGAPRATAEAEDDEKEVLRVARGDPGVFRQVGVLWVGEEVPRGSGTTQGAAAQELLQHHAAAGPQAEACDRAIYARGAVLCCGGQWAGPACLADCYPEAAPQWRRQWWAAPSHT